MTINKPIVVCLHRSDKRHRWRAVGIGETMMQAMAEAERAGFKGGEWRFNMNKLTDVAEDKTPELPP